MKKCIAFILFVIFGYSAYSQNLDLIVNMQGDSIVCKIDSITDSYIFFNLITKSGSSHQGLSLNLVKSYGYNSVTKEQYTFENGIVTLKTVDEGSYEHLKMKYSKKSNNNQSKLYSLEHLQNISSEELDYYFFKAMKKKKTGMRLTIAGPITFGVGVLLWASAWSGGSEAMLGIGSVFILTGGVVTLVGIPMWATGTERVKRITEFKNRIPNEVYLEISPYSFQFNQAQCHQVGISVKVRF